MAFIKTQGAFLLNLVVNRHEVFVILDGSVLIYVLIVVRVTVIRDGGGGSRSQCSSLEPRQPILQTFKALAFPKLPPTLSPTPTYTSQIFHLFP